ncbi:hypothetical protein CAI16_09995 [Virgibacillus dokdonensis]|uniref:N-acetyltransferase domain-containing protein n=1 Tax=Virgibacillus dokdonensis TaxID=302167 RepID=A0A3E0WQ26_9BACI|nr:GNAT family N-acetyltransferase [Virgibacillus dokdonensis]RFA34928.1 hypothetical protein CAI16_09995 [Virgibacillus dokdonensis]
MVKYIRKLQPEDEALFRNMNTGIEDDYVANIFSHLTTGNHRLFGLFLGPDLASVGGYSLFANRFAMLGRVRSHQSYKGKNLSTELMNFVLYEAFHNPSIQWVGANTQENNTPARRVLEKLGLRPRIALYNALAEHVYSLATHKENNWQPVLGVSKKIALLDKYYIKPAGIIPYECYYPLPASLDLITVDQLHNWDFYENKAATRFLILKEDQKKHQYLHIVYPWKDFMNQPGFWETVNPAYERLKAETNADTYIWLDLTKEETASLPNSHPFYLRSPWVLYEIERNMWEKGRGELEEFV